MQMIDHEERFGENPPLQLNLADLWEWFVMGMIWEKPTPTMKTGNVKLLFSSYALSVIWVKL